MFFKKTIKQLFLDLLAAQKRDYTKKTISTHEFSVAAVPSMFPQL